MATVLTGMRNSLPSHAPREKAAPANRRGPVELAAAVLAGAVGAAAAAARVELGGLSRAVRCGWSSSVSLSSGGVDSLPINRVWPLYHGTESSEKFGHHRRSCKSGRCGRRNGALLSASRPPCGAGAARGRGTPLRRGRREAPAFHPLAQAAGFTLAEIGELLDLDASDDRARARELPAPESPPSTPASPSSGKRAMRSPASPLPAPASAGARARS